jgi:hypothetical protein
LSLGGVHNRPRDVDPGVLPSRVMSSVACVAAMRLNVCSRGQLLGAQTRSLAGLSLGACATAWLRSVLRVHVDAGARRGIKLAGGLSSTPAGLGDTTPVAQSHVSVFNAAAHRITGSRLSVHLQSGDREVAVVWSAPRAIMPSEGLGFVVRSRTRSTSGTGRWRLLRTGPRVRQTVIRGLTDGTSVEVRVSARTRLGVSRASVATAVVGAPAVTSGGVFNAIGPSVLLGSVAATRHRGGVPVGARVDARRRWSVVCVMVVLDIAGDSTAKPAAFQNLGGRASRFRQAP